MNRRNFLTLAAAAVPAALILPELLIPRRTFFMPPAGGWAQPSLTDLWLNYANLIRPAGLLVTATTSIVRRPPSIHERGPGHIELVVPEETDAELRTRMIDALNKFPPPLCGYGYPMTYSDLMPWVRRPRAWQPAELDIAPA